MKRFALAHLYRSLRLGRFDLLAVARLTNKNSRASHAKLSAKRIIALYFASRWLVTTAFLIGLHIAPFYWLAFTIRSANIPAYLLFDCAFSRALIGNGDTDFRYMLQLFFSLIYFYRFKFLRV